MKYEETEQMNIRARMRVDLRMAMRARQSQRVKTLRTVLAAIDNAEAVEEADITPSMVGWMNNVPRKELTEENIAQIVQREADECLAAAQHYAELSRHDIAAQLEQEAGWILSYLHKDKHPTERPNQ